MNKVKNGSRKILNRANKYFKNEYKNIKDFDFREYTSTNILFLTFVISNFINAYLLRCFSVHNYFAIKPMIADMTFLLLIGSFAYLIKGKKQFRYFFITSIFLNIVCIANSIYYSYYSSFASFSLLSTLSQLSDVSDAVTKNILSIKDFLFIWQPITLVYIHRKLIKTNYYPHAQKIEAEEKRFSRTLTISIFAFIIFFLSCTTTELSRLYKQWNREFTVSKFGVYTYQANDLFKTIGATFASSFGHDNALDTFNDFYDNRDNSSANNSYTNIFKGKNVIFIHAESMQEFTMNVNLNGVELTPNLNKLAKSGIFFSNFYAQVSTGTSSDTEFTLNTSLMPINNGTVFVSYWNRKYISMQQLLRDKGYYCFSMHGNNATYWNRLVMHEKLGYNELIAKDQYNIDEVIGLGISDSSFFKQSVDKIQKISTEHKLFSATLIMLTNHTPFYDVSAYSNYDTSMKYTVTNEDGTTEEKTADYLEGSTIGRYFKSVHYADNAIGELVANLDSKGLLDNTVIVIYGDHDARIDKDQYNLLYNYDPTTGELLDKEDPNYVTVDYYKYELNRKVPLIIWSKDLAGTEANKEISTAMGMYDVMPTLANMFGFENSKYALGHDIMNLTDNLVAFPNGNWLTNNIYYNAQKDEFSLLNNTSTLSQDEINENSSKAEKYLSVSQAIILYDLIKETTTQK